MPSADRSGCAQRKPSRKSNRYDIDIRIQTRASPTAKAPGRQGNRRIGASHEHHHVKVSALSTPHPPILKKNFAYNSRPGRRSSSTPCDTVHDRAGGVRQGADLLIHEALYVPGVDALRPGQNAASLKAHLLAAHPRREVRADREEAGVEKLYRAISCPATIPRSPTMLVRGRAQARTAATSWSRAI